MLIEFYHRFAQTLEIGLPILSSLEEIGGSLPCRPLKGILEEVQFAVEGGNSLHEAMHRYPWAFQPLDLALISMGEKSGVLPRCLRDQATYHKWKSEIRAVFKKALLYPAFIGFAIVAVIGLIAGGVFLLTRSQPDKVVQELVAQLPPFVIDRAPARGEEQGAEAPIRISFDKPMDRASVECRPGPPRPPGSPPLHHS